MLEEHEESRDGGAHSVCPQVGASSRPNLLIEKMIWTKEPTFGLTLRIYESNAG